MIPRKFPDKRAEGGTDKPYFNGPFRLPPGCPITKCSTKLSLNIDRETLERTLTLRL